jgi:hypothetical protein
MTKLKTMIGICAVSAIAICAFAAQGASAQLAYLCSPGAITLSFEDAHCLHATGIPAKQKFGHRAIALNTGTAIFTTNLITGTELSTTKIKSVQSGVTLELQSTEVSGEGSIENKEEGATTWTEGTGVITFKNVTVTAPAGKGCKVKGGSVTTNKLTNTTKGLTNQVKISPSGGGNFAEFTVEGCSIAALNHAYTVTGSVIANAEGATRRFTHAATTEQGTLFTFGQKAGIDGLFTTKDAGTGEGIVFT